MRARLLLACGLVGSTLTAQTLQFHEFARLGLPGTKTWMEFVEFADLDGDGNLDLLVATERSQPVFAYFGDGRERFSESTPFAGSNVTGGTVGTGDFDGDGDTDVILGNWCANAQLFRNDGNRRFTDISSQLVPRPPNATYSIAVGDVDGDRDLDLVFGTGYTASNPREGSKLYLNDGKGSFTDVSRTHFPPDQHSSWLKLGDVDGDRDLDVVIGVYASRNRLYLNDGKGKFTDVSAARFPPDLDWSFGVGVADFDGDGDLDVLFGNNMWQNRLYLNDGHGYFTEGTAGRMPIERGTTVQLRVLDFDLDGDLDVVLTNFGQPKLYQNNGKAVFSDVSSRFLPQLPKRTERVAAGDIDNDGDPDLVFGTTGYYLRGPDPDVLLFNLHHQAYAATEARHGKDYTLTHYVSPGYGTTPVVGLPLVTIYPARIPHPWGVFGLDPLRSLVFPAHVVLPGIWERSLTFTLPGGGLSGRTLLSQILTIRDPSRPATWRLTNTMSDPIR